MKVSQRFNNRLKYTDKNFYNSVILGFFVGFGMILNLVPPEEGDQMGIEGFLFLIVIGFTFWGIGFNIFNMLTSRISSWMLLTFFKEKIEKEKIFILISWSSAPFIIGIITGILRFLIKGFDVGIYAFTLLSAISILILFNKIKEIRKRRLKIL